MRGSTTALTDKTGKITDRYTYGAYGELGGHIGDSNTPFLYNGCDGVITDSNGLYYMRARYYSPTLKRLFSSDPIDASINDSRALNKYAYANGDPISMIDPFGMCADPFRTFQNRAQVVGTSLLHIGEGTANLIVENIMFPELGTAQQIRDIPDQIDNIKTQIAILQNPTQFNNWWSNYDASVESLSDYGDAYVNTDVTLASTAIGADELFGVKGASNYKVVNEYTAEETNQWFVDNVKPDYQPPYKPGTVVNEIELTQDSTFVRVYDKTPGGSGMYGSWVMRAEDIEGLTAKQIQDKFALPNTPKYICDVRIDAGTHMRVGEVNPLDGWGNGGGTQYDLIGQRVGNFTIERPIK